MYATMFNLTYLTVCICIFYSFGDLTNVVSEVLLSLNLVISTIVLIAFMIVPQNFNRFRLSFKPTKVTFYHYFFHILCIIAGTCLLALLPEIPWTPYIPQGLLFLYTLIRRPYNFLSENLRAALNLLVMLTVTSMRVYISFADEEVVRSWRSYVFPGVIELLIFITVIWAYVVVIRDIVKEYLLKKKKDDRLIFRMFDEMEKIRKIEETAMNSDAFRPAHMFHDFRIPDEESQSAKKRRLKAQKMKEKEKEFQESIELTPQ